MSTHSSILAWKIHGQRSLVGYSAPGRKESDMTERLHFHFHFLNNFQIYIVVRRSPHAHCTLFFFFLFPFISMSGSLWIVLQWARRCRFTWVHFLGMWTQNWACWIMWFYFYIFEEPPYRFFCGSCISLHAHHMLILLSEVCLNLEMLVPKMNWLIALYSKGSLRIKFGRVLLSLALNPNKESETA